MPLFDAGNDSGLFVKAILTQREKLLGKNVLAATDYYTPPQIIETFKELYPQAGKEASFVSLGKEEYKGMLKQAGMPEHAQEEMAQNMMFMDEFGYFGKESLEESHKVRLYFAVICYSSRSRNVVDSADLGDRFSMGNPQR